MTNPFQPIPASQPMPEPPTEPAPRSRIVTIIGWVLLVIGVLVAIGSIPAGNGFGGVLIGLALAFGGAAMVWRFLTWKIATPIAVVLLFTGAAVSPTPPEKPSDTVRAEFHHPVDGIQQQFVAATHQY